MDLKKIKNIMKDCQVGYWLIYQYQGIREIGLNPLANEICDPKELVTRPWFCLITASTNKPIWILQSMEQEKFGNKIGKKLIYTSRDSLVEILKKTLPKRKKIAMEISKMANIPELSRVDYGTVDLIKQLTGSKIISSQNLVGSYLSTWGKQGLLYHQQAVNFLIKIFDETKEKIKNELGKITDYEAQVHIEKLYKKYGLTTVYHPVVATGPDTSNPHHFPSAESPKKILPNQLLLIDVWGKIAEEKSVFADMTKMFYTGHKIPTEIQKSWGILIKARNAALTHIVDNIKKQNVKGNQVDKITRKIIADGGYGPYFVHRTGHNLTTELHGYGPNLDNYETKDDRFLLLDSGYSIEPGIYTSKFGLRSEINIYIDKNKNVMITTPVPGEIERIIND